MARKLEDQVNVDAPSGDYPYGRIRDDNGTGNGTPLTEAVHGDYHQFFARLLAISGVVANDMPDNNANGFQYYLALQAVIDAAVDALETALSGDISALQSYVDAADGVLAGLISALDTRIDAIEAELLALQGEKVVNIGDWNMDADQDKLITIASLSLPVSYKNIRSVSIMIRDDGDSGYYPLNSASSGAVNGGVEQITSVNIYLRRNPGEFFDSASFQATSYNRGFITIRYQK